MTEKLEKTPNARERILSAVITCVEKYGINNLTSRSIAAEAGTNVASINYYFRSKEALVNEALSMSLNHMVGDVATYLENTNLVFAQRLEALFFYLIDGAHTFPGVMMADLYSALVEKRMDTPGAQAMLQVYALLIEHTVAEFPQVDAEKINLVIYQVFSGTLLTMLSPGFVRELHLSDLDQREEREKYARFLTQLIISQLQSNR